MRWWSQFSEWVWRREGDKSVMCELSVCALTSQADKHQQRDSRRTTQAGDRGSTQQQHTRTLNNDRTWGVDATRQQVLGLCHDLQMSKRDGVRQLSCCHACSGWFFCYCCCCAPPLTSSDIFVLSLEATSVAAAAWTRTTRLWRAARLLRRCWAAALLAVCFMCSCMIDDWW